VSFICMSHLDKEREEKEDREIATKQMRKRRIEAENAALVYQSYAAQTPQQDYAPVQA